MSKYKRVLLKLSGESLAGKSEFGWDENRLVEYMEQVKEVVASGIEVAIVIGGGNIFRGMKGVSRGFDRVKGDHMGMLATVINGLALQSACEDVGQKAKLFSAIRMEPVAEYYSKPKAIEAMQSGAVAILTAGTSNPYFTTDTASALRGIEVEANVFLKGTRVDGIYTADPEKDKTATKYESITFADALSKKLKIMDLTAFTLCMENNLPVIVFDMNKPGTLKRILAGENLGTLVYNQ